jgi:hypothetical protein
MRTLVVLGLVVALAGCGWSQPPGPEQTVLEYRAARMADDAARSCALLSARSLAPLVRSFGPCPRAGTPYDDTEAIHVRPWVIRSVTVRGDHATVRLGPGWHAVDQRLTLVRESGGWKLERAWRAMTERSGWEHCVMKYTADVSADPDWQRLGSDVIYGFTEHHCAAAERLPRDADTADFDRLYDTGVQRLVDKGLITADQARTVAD